MLPAPALTVNAVSPRSAAWFVVTKLAEASKEIAIIFLTVKLSSCCMLSYIETIGNNVNFFTGRQLSLG